MRWVLVSSNGCPHSNTHSTDGLSIKVGEKDMHKTLPAFVLFTLFSITGFCPQARAQFAVIDVGAIAQLMQQVRQMQQALQTAQNQLNQAEQEYQSITGIRGMQNLLSSINRN